MTCRACGGENPAGSRFCRMCGAGLGGTCPSCGREELADSAFCGSCGTRLDSVAAPPQVDATTPAPATSAAPRAERRQVSVLFVDLVGFTPLSEDRDPEAVRDLLSDYFDRARTIVDRYGGAIEKFIGDAVMAVWGTPVAREDDGERAVRAGLDLVDAVAALGEGSAGLHARAGVVTGEAAVRLDAVGQGMVAGDVVNTAARVQSAAQPGTVWVDETTRDASARSIGYADAGEHALKGKADPVPLWRAVQVIAGAAGAQRFDGLEAPFLGRDRELRIVKELFHDSAEQSRARLVLVSGVAGVGKSRLGWEFFKYLDGIALETFWHVGRCLSYGEGIAYWALAEMVRMRLRITEGDPEDVVASRLDDGVATYLDDPEDRAWVRPRLAVLLGIAQSGGQELARESLYAGWRLFLERLAAQDPVVLVFEDMQLADDGLLDFVDHLLERSADLPIFVLGLTRPEVFDHRPAWGGAHRAITPLTLDPLPLSVQSEIVGELVYGLPDDTQEALAARAEGIPLFAIETVRMLIDRDVVVPRDGVYVLAGEIGDVGELDVPPTLQALVAARLDNLAVAERQLVKDAAVLGLSFTSAALTALEAAVDGTPADQVEGLLASLGRKEIVTFRGDDRLSEAGQYRFVQKVTRTVAYDTLSRRDRKARHLAVAEYSLGSAETDIAGVIASHFLAAADAVPDDPDVDELRSAAVVQLEEAGDRARSLAAIGEALRYYERALGLAATDPDRARLAEQAGRMARRLDDLDRARRLFGAARAIHEMAGDLRAVARVVAQEGRVLGVQNRAHESLALMTEAYVRADDGTPNADLADLAGSIAVSSMVVGNRADAGAWVERALVASQAAGAWEVLVGALNAKGIHLDEDGRRVEALAATQAAYDLAVRHGFEHLAGMIGGNLSFMALYHDLARAERLALAAREHARRAGDRGQEAAAIAAACTAWLYAGSWDRIDTGEVRNHLGQLEGHKPRISLLLPLVALSCWRAAPDLVDGLDLHLGDDVEDAESRVALATVEGLLAGARGDHAGALAAGRTAVDLAVQLGYDDFLLVVPPAVDWALAVDRVDVAHDLIDRVASRPPGLIAPLLAAQLTWLRARLAAADDADDAGDLFTAAARGLRGLGARFWLAWAQLDHATWLSERDDERVIEVAREAVEIFATLGARPFLARAEALLPATERGGPVVTVSKGSP